MLICLIYQEGTLEEDFVAAEPKHPHVVVIGDPYGDYTCHIVVESDIVIRSIASFPESIKLLFCLFYVLDIAYPKNKRRDSYVYEYLQKVIFGLEKKTLSPKLTTLVNKLAA